MRYKTAVSFALVSSSLAASEDWGLNHHWALTGDVVFMKREELHGHEVAERVESSGTHHVLSTKNPLHDFEYEPGLRLDLAYTPDSDRTIDANFLYITEWSGDSERHAHGSLQYPFHNTSFTHDYVNADKAEAKYHSRFYSAELNYWRHITPRRVDIFSGSWMVGLRYLYLGERCSVEFMKALDKSHYRVRTRNLMGGPQIGGCLEWNPTEHLTWIFDAKFAPLFNRAQQKTFLGDLNDTVVIRNFTKRTNDATFLADLALAVHFQPTSHFNMHLGYQLIYLAGLALAGEQFSNSSEVEAHKWVATSGNALIHGPYAGLTFSF